LLRGNSRACVALCHSPALILYLELNLFSFLFSSSLAYRAVSLQ
jgi:hypothetical protein